MPMDGVDRRSFLKTMGSASLSTALPALAFAAPSFAGNVVHEVAQSAQIASVLPANSVRFAVAGMSHDHIYGMVDAMIRGGGELVSVYSAEPERGAAFLKRYPQVRAARSEDEILNDPSIQLVLSSAIPNQRAPLGIRVMRHGKDFLSDKPGVTTLEQLAAVRSAIAQTKRIFAIMYSERLEVKAAVRAGELVQAGAIGKVIQTTNIAPHQIVQSGGDSGGASPRPDWFWNPEKYGGILTDIGSHQVDQFLFYTGSTHAEVVASQVANVRHNARIPNSRISATCFYAATPVSAMSVWTGSPPREWAHRAMGGFLSWVPMDTSNCKVCRYRRAQGRQPPVHRRPEGGPLYRLQQPHPALRAAVDLRHRPSHPHRA